MLFRSVSQSRYRLLFPSHDITRYLTELDQLSDSAKASELKEFNELGGAKPKFAYPPQLIIVDGGKGQVSAAAAALSELGISDIALCGLAKRLEEVWLPNNPVPVMFARNHSPLGLAIDLATFDQMVFPQRYLAPQ